MKKETLPIFTVFLLLEVLFACKKDNISSFKYLDLDSIQYKTIVIGSQIWHAENFRNKYFQNGEAIFQAKNKQEWLDAANKKQAAWCYLNWDSTTDIQLGKLYNWYAVTDTRIIAPQGWHVSSSRDWVVLESYANYNIAGSKLKSKTGWYNNQNGNDTLGFHAYPLNSISNQGIFESDATMYARFHTGLAHNEEYCCARTLAYNLLTIDNGVINKTYGLSIRMVKD